MPNLLAGSENPDLACTRPETDYPAAAPLIALLRRPQEWIENRELVAALWFLGASSRGAVVQNWKAVIERNCPAETRIDKRPTRDGRVADQRLYSKHGAIVIGLSGHTDVARDVRNWLAATIVTLTEQPRQALAREAATVTVPQLVEMMAAASQQGGGDALRKNA